MADKRPRKLRAQFKKNRAPRAREADLTRQFAAGDDQLENVARDERLSGKGDLTRKRTVMAVETDRDAPGGVTLDTALAGTEAGRVVSVHGLHSFVQLADGRRLRCATRGILRTLATSQRQVVAPGDAVRVRVSGDEGVIERVEPRYGTLSRTSRGREHVLVTNVDQLLIVSSADQPPLKPNLIDRFLVTAERSGIQPLICINKVDLVELPTLMPLVGVYSQMGYEVLLLSAATGLGIERLRRRVLGRHSAVAGQSGVGKSSLLNAVETGLELRVADVCEETQKGRHTTTSATLVPLAAGGFVVDTPGIRQFELWDIVPAEVAGWFRDLRPFVSQCRFPDCTHTHEEQCAVKDAVADELLDARRYESFRILVEGDGG